MKVLVHPCISGPVRSAPVNSPVEKLSQEQWKSQPRAKTENFWKPRQKWLFESAFLNKPRPKLLIFDSPRWKKLLVFLTQWLKFLPQWIFFISKSPRWAFKTNRVTETGVFIILLRYEWLNIKCNQNQILIQINLSKNALTKRRSRL